LERQNCGSIQQTGNGKNARLAALGCNLLILLGDTGNDEVGYWPGDLRIKMSELPARGWILDGILRGYGD
jgi:hypothetical protein